MGAFFVAINNISQFSKKKKGKRKLALICFSSVMKYGFSIIWSIGFRDDFVNLDG